MHERAEAQLQLANANCGEVITGTNLKELEAMMRRPVEEQVHTRY